MTMVVVDRTLLAVEASVDHDNRSRENVWSSEVYRYRYDRLDYDGKWTSGSRCLQDKQLLSKKVLKRK